MKEWVSKLEEPGFISPVYTTEFNQVLIKCHRYSEKLDIIIGSLWRKHDLRILNKTPFIVSLFQQFIVICGGGCTI